MARAWLIAAVLVVAASLSPAPARAATKDEADSYERIISILITGSAENKRTAKEALGAMGFAGLELLKADADKPDTPRGAVAWAALKEFLSKIDENTTREVELRNTETLRDFARRNIEQVAKDWNASYKAKLDRERQNRQKDVVSDYITLLSASDKTKDFDLLLKVLRSSLIVSDNKADYGAEFDVWMRVWRLISDRVGACETVKDLQGWQSTLDDHFRKYSLLKNYAGIKAIQAYHTATLQILQRIDELRKKPKGAVG